MSWSIGLSRAFGSSMASLRRLPSRRRCRSSIRIIRFARRPGQPWFGSGKTASGVEERPSGGGGLHAEQHFEYHRPLRPGDVLTVETKPGNTWERESKRAGKLTFRERITEYRDQKGELGGHRA